MHPGRAACRGPEGEGGTSPDGMDAAWEILSVPPGCPPYQFGSSLAACGDELLVGAPDRDYVGRQAATTEVPPPATCLLRRFGGSWGHVQTLVAPVPSYADGFGRSVALGYSFAAVGSAGNENGDGPTYLYSRTAQGDLRLAAGFAWPGRQAPYETVFAEYGAAVAVGEGELLVGAPLDSSHADGDAGGQDSGAVYRFDGFPAAIRAGTFRGRPGENLGSSIALAGNILVIGAARIYTSEPLPGAVYVHRRTDDGSWHEVCRIEGGTGGQHFGAGVATDGELIAVTAPLDPAATASGLGKVHLYELREERCAELAVLPDLADGGGLALRGPRLVIGQSAHQTSQTATQVGRVGLFDIGATGEVSLAGWWMAPRPTDYARFGDAVALGPDYVAAGAPGLGEDDSSGYVAVMRW
jgi:hypothetical protein